MNVGILTCARLPELLESDQKLIPLFAKENLTAKAVIWDDESINWTEFDCLIFRNTWDYYQKEIAFNHWLDKIETLGIKTWNPISTIQKNKHKFYLKKLEKEGLVSRQVFKQFPPRVEYSITNKALELRPVIKELKAWAKKHCTKD